MNWYQIDSKEIFLKLNTLEEGLTDKEVKERLIQYGPNKLAEEEKINKLKILLHQFTSPLIYILLLAAIVTFILIYAMIAAFFAQLAVLYVPALQWIFRTVPLTTTEWLEIILVTVTIIIAVEMDKWIRRRKLSVQPY